MTVPNTFVNGTPADANEVNANFQALKTGVETCLANAAAAAAGNQAVCESVGGTWDGTTCTAAPCDVTSNDAAIAAAAAAAVDITTDNAAAYAEGVASVDITTDNAAVAQATCTTAGGTWDAGMSTCTPNPTYNCFVGGFCSQAAIDFPPATFGYTNVYEGDTPGTEPALGAGCNVFPASTLWSDGVAGSLSYLPFSVPLLTCASN